MKFIISNITYGIFAKKGLELLKIHLVKGKKNRGRLFYQTLIQKKQDQNCVYHISQLHGMCAVTGAGGILLYGLLNLKSLVKV